MSPRSEKQNEILREQSKAAILQAAFELFAHVGFDNTSMAAIAHRAKVSKGLIYHHFKNKEDVLVGVFDQLAKVGSTVLDQIEERLSPHQKLLNIIDLTVHFMKDNPGWVKLMIHLALQEDVIAGLHAHIETLRKSKMTQVIPIFKEMGYEDFEAAAYCFGAQLDGLTLGWLSLGDHYPLDSVVQQLKEQYNLIS